LQLKIVIRLWRAQVSEVIPEHGPHRVLRGKGFSLGERYGPQGLAASGVDMGEEPDAADTFLAEVDHLKHRVAPSDPLAALVVSAEASAKASRTSLLALYKVARDAREAEDAAAAANRLQLVGSEAS
jgi:hypothetical protein